MTDASVVLGYLNPHSLAGGSVPIDRALAREALQRIATRLGVGVLEAAHGIHRLANATMMRAVKAVSTYRGRDPREFTLFAFGGNGGVHAAALARELQMKQVIVPPAAGVFSAVGLLCADHEAVRSAAFLRPLDADSVAEIARHCRALERQALDELDVADPVSIRWRAELRYAGQGFELPVDLKREATGANEVTDIRARFEREYERTYGHALENRPIDFVALRVIAAVPSGGPGVTSYANGSRAGAVPQWREAYFGRGHGLVNTPVIRRQDLSPTPRPGPLIVEEYEGTTVVPPAATAALDALENIVITLEGERTRAS